MQCHYAECYFLFIAVLSVMLSAVMPMEVAKKQTMFLVMKAIAAVKSFIVQALGSIYNATTTLHNDCQHDNV